MFLPIEQICLGAGLLKKDVTKLYFIHSRVCFGGCVCPRVIKEMDNTKL